MVKTIIEPLLSFSRYIFFEVMSPKFNAAAFKNIMDYFYVILEKFAYSFEILSSNYLKLYEKSIEKEIEMAKIKTEDKILIIGCGSLPATTILIGQKIKANIIAIDYDYNAVKKANTFIDKLDIKSNIKIEFADGLKYPIQKFDIIFVLYGVKKQKQLLEKLSKQITKTTKIIFRTNKDALNLLLGGEKFLSKFFLIKDIFYSENMYTSISYLLTKKE